MGFKSKYADLHMHTLYSDGTDSPEQLLLEAKAKGLSVISVTDHDTVDFYKNTDYKNNSGITVISGIEFSCRTSYGKCHILGYNIDTGNKHLADTIAHVQKIRKDKLYKRLSYLENEYGIIFTDEEKIYLESLDSAGKPHIAGIIVKRGLAQSIGDAIGKYLSKIPKDEEDRIDAESAIGAIISSGGIPIWAHPLGGEGEKRLTDDEFEMQFKALLGYGIRGVELYYSRYSFKDRERILNCVKKFASEYKLCFSGGSDYHGKVKNIEAGTLSFDDESIPLSYLTVLNYLNY